jgi:hypothetical protein
MSETRFIFDTVDYQNGANTVNNYVTLYNAQNNAAVTGNGFKFKSDADRMKNLLGSKGQTRNSGYYDGLYGTFYNLTFTDGATIPSINGPGNAGWGAKLWSGPIPDLVNITDDYLQPRAKQTNYVAIQISGYLYSPVATTVILQVTSDDGVAIFLNGTNTTFTPASPDAWGYHGPTTYTSGTLTVNAGYNPITIRYFEGGGGSQLTLAYRLGSQGYQNLFGCNFFYNYNQM